MPESIPPTAYHTALTVLSQALLLPAEEHVPFINRVAALASPPAGDDDVKAWLKMRGKMHDAVRKVTNIAQQLAEQFEMFELQNPASIRQLDLFPGHLPRETLFMGGPENEDERD